MDTYRIDRQRLVNEIGAWGSFLKRKVHLIACGGTALTLLGIKPSTKDIDLIVPELKEYDYLIAIPGKDIDLKLLEKRFRETASCDVSEERVDKNLEYFLKIVKEGRKNG